MKMQHTIYLEMKHKIILDEIMREKGIGNGKQGTPNYNKAVLQCIEAIDTAREAHFQALQKQCRLRAHFQDDERFFSMVEAVRTNAPKKYKKVIEGTWKRWKLNIARNVDIELIIEHQNMNNVFVEVKKNDWRND